MSWEYDMSKNGKDAVHTSTHTGVLELKNGEYALVSDADGTRKNLSFGIPEGCRVGDKVCASEKDGALVVTENFGPADGVDANIKAVLRAEVLDEPFDFDALMQAKQSAFTEITTHLGHRADLRGKTVVTLSESENSRIECGFSVERDKAGNYVLGIHTVDAAALIPKGSALEKAAFTRGKTAVLPDREIPMLPDVLTKGPCFFEVGEDRLAVSYLMTIDGEGRILDFDFCESVVKIAANCLFDEIQALLLDFDTSAIMPLRESYASVLPALTDMFVLGGILQGARLMRGDPDTDVAERRFVYGRHGGKPRDLVCEKESDPKRLIREFLAIAGVRLAQYLNKNGVPALYRVQPAPDEAATERFRAEAEALGIDLNGVEGDAVFACAAEKCHGTRTEELLLQRLHASLAGAGFALKPARHPVHGTDMYIRFAYPVNRLADLCTQRTVKALIKKRGHGVPCNREKLNAYIRAAAEAANRLERRASRAEKKITDLSAMEVLRRAGRRSYGGLVSGVSEAFIEVLLDNGCTGYIELKQDPSAHFEGGAVLVGGKSYAFGSEITARFERADFNSGRLYLSL